MKPFRERNPVIIGALGFALIAAIMTAAFRAADLPIIGGGDIYYAAFSEAGGLQADDEVRVAGVRVGVVEEVSVDDDEVLVRFRIEEDTGFGEETGASIRIKTLLGSMFLALEPAGDGQLAAGDTIPVERTTAPFDVVQAFEGLGDTTLELDTDQLGESFTTLADLTRNTPRSFRRTLRGVSEISETIASRDDELNELLGNLEDVSGVLEARDDDIVALMEDADVLFRAIVARRQAISDLLDATSELSVELTTLVRQTRGDLKPALTKLGNVEDTLLRNGDNLDESLRLMVPFYRVFQNTLGTGPWFDTLIENFPNAVPDLVPEGGGLGGGAGRVGPGEPADRPAQQGRQEVAR